MKNTLYSCPSCNCVLSDDEKKLICKNNHCFDRSKSGYINLLLSTDKNSKLPGDNKLMVDARQKFLSGDYYKILSDALNEMVMAEIHNNSVILDAGCGEGYYTSNLKNFLNKNNINGKFIGIDISKFAIDKAAKRDKTIDWAVSSVFHMPILSNSFDGVINIFAPFALEEYLRILKKGGKLFMVIPAEYHLFELKQAVYSKVFLNEVKDYKIDGFEFTTKKAVEYSITLNNNEDIHNLFTMTPYYYKTSKEDFERLNSLNNLTTKVSFQILVYQKL
ncbi:MAG: methyltransferase domain-containing protein [Oscillospiraceae bacterium]